MSKNNQEIERKWLMTGFPQKTHVMSEYLIEQLYISINPEVRIRGKCALNSNTPECEKPFTLTIKGDGHLVRSEIEIKLLSSQYLALIKAHGGENAVIRKLYKTYELVQEDKAYVLEISNVDADWYYAEIEFESVDEAENFIAPNWFGKEVTTDPFYKMKNYFKRRNGGKNE